MVSHSIATRLAAVLVGLGIVAGPSTAAAISQMPAAHPESVGGPLLAGDDVIVRPLPGGLPPPGVTAGAWVVADLDTADVLGAKAPHRRYRPASTIKMLTAVTLLPLLDKHATYTAVHADAAQIGSSVGLVPGRDYTIDDLFLGLFLKSGNDAAHALGRAGGGVPETVALMQEEAARLRALDTVVANTSGLDEGDQVSSAYDLALIARAGMAREDFRAYVQTERTRFPAKVPGQTVTFANQNKLLGTYPGAIGVKTGYTTLARNTFVAAATRQGQTLLVTMMYSSRGVSAEAAKLLDWGFANADVLAPIGVLVDPVPEPTPPLPATTVAAAAARTSNDDAGRRTGGPPVLVVLVVLAAGAVALRIWPSRASTAP